MIISMIWAMGTNWAIGKNEQLLWKLKGDLPRFKELTMGAPVVMGRKTFESMRKPLPGRTNIVITRNVLYRAPGAVVVHCMKHALDICESKSVSCNEAFVIGGGEIYSMFLPKADKLYMTLVNDKPDADAFFPEYDKAQFKEVSREDILDHTPPFAYITLERQ